MTKALSSVPIAMPMNSAQAPRPTSPGDSHAMPSASAGMPTVHPVNTIACNDRSRIVAAAKRSLADEVIAKLPEGYDQVIGKRFRTGVDLSGGEWQKIAIARAYMRDAQVLVLDEPTAALDARAEFEVFQRFKELSRGKTAVLISHRFSSVRMADRIIVLADGRVDTIGTHDELIAHGGRYAELFELQAAGYR